MDFYLEALDRQKKLQELINMPLLEDGEIDG
jgi:hypothetical protein